MIWPVLLLAEEAIERAGDDPLMLHRLQLVAADIETADDLLRNMLEPAQLTVGRGGLLRVYSLYAFAGAYADAVRPH